jgi:hypothetical protein
MIEALGVPHTEVDSILVNDGPVDFSIWCRTATASMFTPLPASVKVLKLRCCSRHLLAVFPIGIFHLVKYSATVGQPAMSRSLQVDLDHRRFAWQTLVERERIGS